MKNDNIKVLIIGSDHHNTLSAIRSFGKFGCDIYLLVYSDKDEDSIKILNSKYINNNYSIIKEDEEEIFTFMLGFDVWKSNKNIVAYPCTDLAMIVLDKHYCSLYQKYIIPGFIGNPGMVSELMDKWRQKEFADRYGFKMADTWEVSAINGVFYIPDKLEFPCIIKPQISAFGRKDDISICNNITQLQSSLEHLSTLGYTQLLIQKFIKKQYEMLAMGCITKNSREIINATIIKYREFPYDGSKSITTYAGFIFDEDLLKPVNHILKLLKELGYSGHYDIEFLVDQDRNVYLNEMNFRQSGNAHAQPNNGVYTQVIWAMDALGIDTGRMKKKINKSTYMMNEILDFMYVKDKKISKLMWAKCLVRVKSFAYFNIHDIPGAIPFYRPYLNSIWNRISRH